MSRTVVLSANVETECDINHDPILIYHYADMRICSDGRPALCPVDKILSYYHGVHSACQVIVQYSSFLACER